MYDFAVLLKYLTMWNESKHTVHKPLRCASVSKNFNQATCYFHLISSTYVHCHEKFHASNLSWGFYFTVCCICFALHLISLWIESRTKALKKVLHGSGRGSNEQNSSGRDTSEGGCSGQSSIVQNLR